MSEQPSYVPEKHSHFDAKEPPAITSLEPNHDPRGRDLENYLAQQIIKEPITPEEMKNAKNFIAGFQTRLKTDRLKGNDIFSYKEMQIPGSRATQTIFPGQEGYPIEEWQKNESAVKRFKKELAKELNDLGQAEIISVEKFHRRYGLKWKAYKVVAESGDKKVILYLLELPGKDKTLTLDSVEIGTKKFTTRY